MRLSISCWAIVATGLAGALGAAALKDAGKANGTALQRPQIRVDVNLALVPVTVLDPMGRNVLGLASGNFRVFDGTQERPIVAFSQEDAPITVGLIFDCSRSMTDKFRVSRAAPGELFAQLNPRDEAFLITVSDVPELKQDFTSDFSSIQNALIFTHPHGATSLVDGVYMGLQRIQRAHNPRKALIVVSDGGENNSRYSVKELQELALESDAQIYSICISYDPMTKEEAEGPDLLEKLGMITGGLRFMMPDTSGMKDAMARIGISMHNQYVLGIVPPPAAPRGKYRRITVQLVTPKSMPKLAVYARSRYFVP